MSEHKIGNVTIYIPPVVNIMAIVLIIVLGVLLFSSNTTIGEHKKTIDDVTESWRLAKDARAQADAAYLSYKIKYEELLDRAWHSKDDLIAYIDSEYTHIPKEIAEVIAESITFALEEHKMDFSLVVGIIEVESRFNPMAKSNKGAVGLMQIMPNIWGKELCIATEKEFYDIATNIFCGVKVFLHNLDRSNGDIHEALWRYNGTGGKKGEFADLVYKAVGKFEVFRAKRNGEYESGEQEGSTVID